MSGSDCFLTNRLSFAVPCGRCFNLSFRSLIHAYTAGEISLGKAAEIMGISSGEMKDILSEK
ncbi:MAG TPA: hypothetical protein DCQ37_23935 [Desulfobacteraceae bacterium]|nr:hypothetical protein [Desulfobacteraceae bacterium]